MEVEEEVGNMSKEALIMVVGRKEVHLSKLKRDQMSLGNPQGPSSKNCTDDGPCQTQMVSKRSQPLRFQVHLGLCFHTEKLILLIVFSPFISTSQATWRN